jgi:hypothetical protein
MEVRMHALDREAREIREAIVALATHKTGRRFDAALQARVVAHVKWRLAGGAALGAVGKSLDISDKTLRRFLRCSHPSSSSTSLIAIEVQPERCAPLLLRGPCGVSVAGDVEQIAALLARLACLV